MSKNRETSIDIAKGIAIIAIVLGHVVRGLSLVGILDPKNANYQFADRLLYMFHLSVFALMAGLFVQHAVKRDGVQQYLRSRNVLFLWLYLVWSLIQGGVKLLTASLVNSPTSITDMLAIWIPQGQFWFFPFLIVMTTTVALIRPWRGPVAGTLSLVCATALSLRPPRVGTRWLLKLMPVRGGRSVGGGRWA